MDFAARYVQAIDMIAYRNIRQSIDRKIKTAQALPRLAKFWFVPALFMLGICNIVIILFPYRTISRFFGHNIGPVAVMPMASSQQEKTASAIGQVVRIAAGYTPWRSDCLRQAMLAIFLCKIYAVPYALHLGFPLYNKRNDDERTAHAWLVSGRVFITGGKSFRQHHSVACYVSDCAAT